MIINFPIQSAGGGWPRVRIHEVWGTSTDTFSQKGTQTKLYCDPEGNRGFLISESIGILFTQDGFTIAITHSIEYKYDPIVWAFMDPFSNSPAAIWMSLDTISLVQKEFSDPNVTITMVENVKDFLNKSVIEYVSSHKLNL